MNFNKIIGDQITGISVLLYDDKIHYTCIEEILITLSNKLFIAVDKEYDEIILKINTVSQLKIQDEYHKIIDIKDSSENILCNLLNKKISWIWTLNNNQGYDDAFQLEVYLNEVREKYQFLAIASKLELYRLTK